MEKLIQTIETLGLPFVGYKMQSEKVDEHLHNRAVAEQYGDLPPYFFQMRTDEDKFLKRVANEFMNVLNAELKSEKVEWKISKLDVCQSDKIIAAGRYIFHDTSDYGEVREVMNALDWDAIALTVQQEVDAYDESQDEQVELKSEVYGHPLDKRWVELWANDAEFDQVFWSAYEKTDIMQWRGYAFQHHWTTSAHAHRALDFICWAMMTQDYDEFMALISDKQVNAKTGIDLFASINTTQISKTPIKESGNTTTMATTQDLATKYAANFAKMMANTNIKNAHVTWSMEGNIVKMVALEESREGYSRITTMTFDSKNKGTNQWTTEVEGDQVTRIDWRTPSMYQVAIDNNFDMEQMGKWLTKACCKKFGIEYIPTPKEERNANRGKSKDSKAVANAERDANEHTTAQTETTPAPKTAPQFKGVSYNDPEGDGIYHLVWVSSDKCHIYGINGEGSVEVDTVLDKANTERCIAKASLKQIATPEKFYDALRKLNLEVAPTPAPKTEAPKAEEKKVVKTLDTKPQPKKEQPKVEQPAPKAETPKVEQPQAEQTPAPKADRLTIDKRDGGLFIGGADADIELLIRSYVDAINAMQMRKIG